MIGFISAVVVGVSFYLFFVVMNAAAHKDVFGKWPQSIREWLLFD